MPHPDRATLGGAVAAIEEGRALFRNDEPCPECGGAGRAAGAFARLEHPTGEAGGVQMPGGGKAGQRVLEHPLDS